MAPARALDSKSGYLFVNKKPLAFHEEVQLRPGSIVHFTQPDTDTAIPHAYRFQILYGLTLAYDVCTK